MKALMISVIALTLGAGSAFAQDPTSQLPEGAMKPATLNDLGASMRDRMTDIVAGDEKVVLGFEEEDESLSLFSGSSDEDEHILEIKKIARELESQRALMIQVSELQKDLIDFARADPVAAHKSRIPSNVCEYALEQRFCDAMTSSFQKRDIIIHVE